MATYGYARCSDPRSTTMSLEVQIEALRAAGCTVIRSERRSGTTLNDRTELRTLLDFLREGDTLCVTRVDRIARSVTDLMIIVRILEQKGVALKATEQPIDTSSAVGRSLLSMLGVFAELETNLAASARWNPSAAFRRSTARSQSTSAPTRAAHRRSSRTRCAVSSTKRSSGRRRSRRGSGSVGRAFTGC